MVAGSVALTTTVVPAFLTGALSGRIGDDLGFGGGGAGAAVAAFFVGAGIFAVPMGRVTERIGPTRALRAGALVSAAAALGIAAFASSLWQLVVLLIVAGSAVGLVDTGAARAFGDSVPSTRHGIAFGAKEASVPAASLAAGLSIPILAEQLGWRSAFVAGALLAPLVWVLVPRLAADRPPSRDGRGGDSRRGPLVLFAGGVALGVGAATAASTLLVPAIEDRGWDEADAGLLLAVASSASIAVRLAAGSRGDRRPLSTWAMVATLLTVGAGGAVLLATTSAGPAGVLGAIAVIGGGWGWTGLAFQTAVRVGRDRPAAAAGLVLTGLSVGGAVGPAAFGAIASALSYSAAWAAAAAALLGGAAAILASKHWLESGSARGQPTGAR
ncbi:MFS transporter [Acidimicrobiia bacterium EGI L10123]|uniref:MFS transporter n=1 Tax=Salinilacustrithrix flava TaxID=2957203 RepID=UPI003D7C17CB|nr:MFS transporter [Acidimicrobiia bacterium EGI L10123]